MVIHFEQMDVKVEQSAKEWTAVELWPEVVDAPIGYGSTMMEAIVDLREKMDG